GGGRQQSPGGQRRAGLSRDPPLGRRGVYRRGQRHGGLCPRTGTEHRSRHPVGLTDRARPGGRRDSRYRARRANAVSPVDRSRPVNARRVVRRVILGFSLLSLVMMGLLWYGLSSERVARRLVATALARAGDGISIGEVSGSIGGPLVVRNVSVERETF